MDLSFQDTRFLRKRLDYRLQNKLVTKTLNAEINILDCSVTENEPSWIVRSIVNNRRRNEWSTRHWNPSTWSGFPLVNCIA